MCPNLQQSFLSFAEIFKPFETHSYLELDSKIKTPFSSLLKPTEKNEEEKEEKKEEKKEEGGGDDGGGGGADNAMQSQMSSL